MHLIQKTIIILFLLFLSYQQASAVETKDWQYEAIIYGWLPSVDGNLKYSVPPDQGSNVSIGVDDYLSNLKLFFMGNLNARRDKFSIYSDIIYLKFSSDENTRIGLGPNTGVSVDANVKQDLSAWLITLTGGYNILNNNQYPLDLMAGVRFMSVDVDANLTLNGPSSIIPPATLEQKETLWDAIVGVKGKYKINNKWYIPYYADIGTGDSRITWQISAAIAYKYNWGDLNLTYRHLEFDQDDNKLLQDFSFSGPSIGASFSF